MIEKLLPLIKNKEADKVSIVFYRSTFEVSRFTNSQIHQHMRDIDETIYFRVLYKGRIGIASTNSLDTGNLTETFKKALHIARLKIETKEKKDIPNFKPLPPLKNIYFEGTPNLPASSRVKILNKIFANAESLAVKFCGNLYNGSAQIGVISPQGLLNSQDYSLAGIKLIAQNKESSGYASAVSHDLNKLGIESASDTAIRKCLHGLKTQELKPGKYDVILEPQAVADLISWLNYIGFGAKSVLEETSFLHNKRGKKITGARVNIYDNGLDKDTLCLPFDFEGIPKKKIYLIKNGLAGEGLTDSFYAKKLKTSSNGHANFPDDTEGPLGYNLIMESGDSTKEQIIKSAKRAILITRFHYINGFLDTHRAVMTGMTRDGAFLIENGQLKYALKNMRFTDSILEAFSRIKHISREKELIAEPLESLGSISAPYIYIEKFNFTS